MSTSIARLIGASPAAQRVQAPSGVAALVGVVAHVFQLGLFAALAIWPMAAYNVVSVAVFIVAFFLFRRSRFRAAMILITIEVILHQVLAVMLCGWGSGFQYFLGTVPLALMLPWTRREGLLVTALAVAAFIVLAALAPAAPAYPIPPLIERILGAANPLMAFSVLWIFMMVYRRKADDTDDALASALARSEALLQAILPASIVDRLREQPTRVAESFTEVSILFADIVGFTPLAERMSPEALVALLDELFADFDALVAARGLEKIKTIGDAYMVAAGVPEGRSDHATAIADLALAIRERADAFARRRGEALTLRIGVHSGAVVAGVIGRTKLAYDLWGDAVNTAARMESHGEPGRIHVSTATAARIAERFVVEPRGVIEVKGKGTMETAWLIGPKSDKNDV